MSLNTARGRAVICGLRVRDGALQPPADVRKLGWWSQGAAPGDGRGSIVITGHVNSATQGAGTAEQFWTTGAGEPIRISTGAGAVHSYRVISRTTYAKTALPFTQLFDQQSPERLVLVTCGGRFDPAQRSYDSNVVVLAVPAGRS